MTASQCEPIVRLPERRLALLTARKLPPPVAYRGREWTRSCRRLTALVSECRPCRTEWVTPLCLPTQGYLKPNVTVPFKPLPKLDVGSSNPIARFRRREATHVASWRLALPTPPASKRYERRQFRPSICHALTAATSPAPRGLPSGTELVTRLRQGYAGPSPRASRAPSWSPRGAARRGEIRTSAAPPRRRPRRRSRQRGLSTSRAHHTRPCPCTAMPNSESGVLPPQKSNWSMLSFVKTKGVPRRMLSPSISSVPSLPAAIPLAPRTSLPTASLWAAWTVR